MDERRQGVSPETPTTPQGPGPEGPATPQGVGKEAELTAGGGEPQKAPPVNLTDIPEFRKWQSAYDQRMSQMERQAREAESRAAVTASELDELRMRDMPADDQATFFRTKLAEERAHSQQRQEETVQAQRIGAQATAFLEKLGLAPDAPGLVWGEKPTPENLARLYESALEAVTARAQQQSQQQQALTEDQLRDARIQALNQAGVTRTGTAAGGTPPEANPIAEIDDPSELLRMGVEAADRGGGRPRG